MAGTEPHSTYDDFSINVSDDVAIESIEGIARAQAAILANEGRLRAIVQEFQRSAAGAAASRDLEPEESTRPGAVRPADAIGRELFEVLFSDRHVLSVYRTSLAKAKSAGRGLRIRLRLSKPWLSLVPWELLYDDVTHQFLGKSTDTPIIREPEVSQPSKPLAISGSLSIFAVTSTPNDQAPLAVLDEMKRLERSLGGTNALLKHVPEASASRVFELLTTQGANYHIFHFAGHATFDEATGEGKLVQQPRSS